MTPRRQHLLAALQRRGKRERPQQSSVRAVPLLAHRSGTSPHLLAASELPHDIGPRTNVAPLAPPSMRLCSSGLRFFSLHVLARDRKLLALMRVPSAYQLPALLRVPDVRRVLSLAPPCPTVCPCPPSRAGDADCTQDSCSKSLTATAHDSWSTCSGARGPRRAPSPSLQLLSPSCDTPGHPPAIPLTRGGFLKSR